MSFVKLDCGILDSTIWVDREAREVFITALLMAKPRQINECMEQISVRTLEPTGFVLPPGWYGWIAAAGSGIVRRAGVEIETGLSALERLGAPEMDSRTPDFEGRRLIRVARGYIALNYMQYREKDHTAADRMRRWRNKPKGATAAQQAADRLERNGDEVGAARVLEIDEKRRELDQQEREERASGKSG